jgi:hypothetical protein
MVEDGRWLDPLSALNYFLRFVKPIPKKVCEGIESGRGKNILKRSPFQPAPIAVELTSGYRAQHQ